MSLPPLHSTSPEINPTVRALSVDTVAALRQPHAGTSTPEQPAAKEAPSSASNVEDAIAKLNDSTALIAQDLHFSIDEESGKTVVKLIDNSTQEVLRQFPSEEALSIARSIDKMQGLLIRDQA